jgi:hypothetical protein
LRQRLRVSSLFYIVVEIGTTHLLLAMIGAQPSCPISAKGFQIHTVHFISRCRFHPIKLNPVAGSGLYCLYASQKEEKKDASGHMLG